MKCSFCDKIFLDTINGLIQKTFHESLHDTEIVNS